MPVSTGTLDTISSFTLSQSTQRVSFSNIPQNYQTLVLSIQGDFTHSTQSYIRFWPNGWNSGQYVLNSYSMLIFLPGGSPAISFAANAGTDVGFTSITPDAGTRSLSTELTIFNYSSNSFGHRQFLFDSRMNSSVGGYGGYGISRLTTTEPINSFTLQIDSGGFSAGTQFLLYGISSHQVRATGGDVIWSDGSYWYHSFFSSGTFTPTANMNVEALVVAGGGGGGGMKGGGGGAGGVCHHTSKSLTGETSYSIVVGGGGAGRTNNMGVNGSNTTFTDITAIGGGGGASNLGYDGASNNGKNGGSGGAATRTGTPGSATQGNSGGATGYGFNGGSGAEGVNGGVVGGGGGGGSGQAGQSAPTTGDKKSGDGGAGKNTWSTWVYASQIKTNTGHIAGGGGGGSYFSGSYVHGGLGGSGHGGSGGTYDINVGDQQGSDAVVNTGSGGGGGADGGFGGNGASGFVILRYTV